MNWLDPFEVVSDGRHGLISVRFTDAKVRTLHFDADSDAAQTQQRLERSFPDSAVRITSTTTDGKLSVVQVSSDRDPGSYFLYNHATKKADFIFSVSSLDPAAIAAVRGVDFKARDGLDLHGFLTRPSGANGAGPLVLLVHGGPISIFDRWEFDLDSQLLSKAGYSVLRVNYRGSGNYGRAYTHAGAREWGGRMQDDLDDAVRWAIAEGIADPERIAIVGGSYGAYAALMGVARTPELYKCAVGYVGVYDLDLMVDDDKNSARWIGNWLEEWVGDDELLRARSPTRLAAGIKAPVLLVAGHEDWIAPIEHSRRMERALKKAGADVETLYVDREGHGFYAEANRRAYYRRLLTFLHRHLGGAVAN